MSKTDRFRLEHISVYIEKIIKLTKVNKYSIKTSDSVITFLPPLPHPNAVFELHSQVFLPNNA